MAFCSQCGAQLVEGAKFCPQCGAATSGNAVAAPPAQAVPPTRPAYPAAPVAPSGGGGARLILPLIAIVAIAVIGFVLWSQRDGTQPIAGGDRQEVTADRDTASKDDAPAAAEPRERETATADAPRADIDDGATVTSAATLDSQFFRDPQGAAMRYTGPLRVSGIIATMVQPGSTPSLALEGRSRFNFMVVNFPAGYREALAPLSKGQFITVDCANVRSLGGTTILGGCTLA